MLERLHTQGWLLREHDLWDGERSHGDFAAACSAHRGQRCRLWVSSAMLAELVCDESLPLADDGAAIEWARGVFQHYHGEAASTWSLAAWQAGARRGVTALRSPALAALQAAAAASSVRLLAVAPWWTAVLARALRDTPALRQGPARLVLAEGTCVTAIELEGGALSALQIRRIDAAVDGALQDWCAEQPARQTIVLGYGVAGQAQHGADLAAPGQARPWLFGAPA